MSIAMIRLFGGGADGEVLAFADRDFPDTLAVPYGQKDELEALYRLDFQLLEPFEEGDSWALKEHEEHPKTKRVGYYTWDKIDGWATRRERNGLC